MGGGAVTATGAGLPAMGGAVSMFPRSHSHTGNNVGGEGDGGEAPAVGGARQLSGNLSSGPSGDSVLAASSKDGFRMGQRGGAPVGGVRRELLESRLQRKLSFEPYRGGNTSVAALLMQQQQQRSPGVPQQGGWTAEGGQDQQQQQLSIMQQALLQQELLQQELLQEAVAGGQDGQQSLVLPSIRQQQQQQQSQMDTSSSGALPLWVQDSVNKAFTFGGSKASAAELAEFASILRRASTGEASKQRGRTPSLSRGRTPSPAGTSPDTSGTSRGAVMFPGMSPSAGSQGGGESSGGGGGLRTQLSGLMETTTLHEAPMEGMGEGAMSEDGLDSERMEAGGGGDILGPLKAGLGAENRSGQRRRGVPPQGPSAATRVTQRSVSLPSEDRQVGKSRFGGIWLGADTIASAAGVPLTTGAGAPPQPRSLLGRGQVGGVAQGQPQQQQVQVGGGNQAEQVMKELSQQSQDFARQLLQLQNGGVPVQQSSNGSSLAVGSGSGMEGVVTAGSGNEETVPSSTASLLSFLSSDWPQLRDAVASGARAMTMPSNGTNPLPQEKGVVTTSAGMDVSLGMTSGMAPLMLSCDASSAGKQMKAGGINMLPGVKYNVGSMLVGEEDGTEQRAGQQDSEGEMMMMTGEHNPSVGVSDMHPRFDRPAEVDAAGGVWVGGVTAASAGGIGSRATASETGSASVGQL